MSVRARLGAAIARDPSAIRQSAAALGLASLGSLVAGLTLGAITDTLDELPGLLLLVPAAIGMRGNVFGALGSRLGTAIHTGTFTISRRADTVVGQNVLAAISLSLVVSLLLAVVAKVVAVGFDLRTMPLTDFVVISVLGGALSSVVVLVVTVTVAGSAASRGWDLDNVAAPIVTATGDMVTLPALWLATFAADVDVVTPVIAAVLVVACAAVAVAVVRAGLPLLRRIARESLPVLLVAATIDVVAGLTIEKRFESSFAALPALLVLIPPFLEDCGALGGILASRISTKLHLGVVEPTAVPARAARDDFVLTLLYAVPLFLAVAISADVVAAVAGLESPGVLEMIAATLLAGAMATVAAIALAYYGGIAAFRLGLDPDNHGIPLVTSSLDLVGAFSLVLALVVLGVA